MRRRDLLTRLAGSAAGVLAVTALPAATLAEAATTPAPRGAEAWDDLADCFDAALWQLTDGAPTTEALAQLAGVDEETLLAATFRGRPVSDELLHVAVRQIELHIADLLETTAALRATAAAHGRRLPPVRTELAMIPELRAAGRGR